MKEEAILLHSAYTKRQFDLDPSLHSIIPPSPRRQQCPTEREMTGQGGKRERGDEIEKE